MPAPCPPPAIAPIAAPVPAPIKPPPIARSAGLYGSARAVVANISPAPIRLAQHGKPHCVIGDGQPDAREGQAGRTGVAERPAVPLKPVGSALAPPSGS